MWNPPLRIRDGPSLCFSAEEAKALAGRANAHVKIGKRICRFCSEAQSQDVGKD